MKQLAFNKISGSSSSNKKLFWPLFATLLLVVAAIVVVGVSVSSRGKNDNIAYFSSSHVIIKSACSSTLYPDLCLSTLLASSNSDSQKVVSGHKDVIELSLNITTGIVQRNYFTVERLLLERKGAGHTLTKRQKTALHDCLETIDETLDELSKAKDDLIHSDLSLSRHTDHLKTLISSAITNQATCLDGFSHDVADKNLRKYLEEGELHAERMCSNALAMTNNLTDEINNSRRKLMYMSIYQLEDKEDGMMIRWPEWISATDRRLLQAGTVTPDVVVAADGSGKFKTVSEAVAAAPEKSSKRYIIKIKAGVYRENVDVPKKKTNIMFVGDGRTNTIITASRNVVDGSTTFNSATVGMSSLHIFFVI